MLEKSIRDFVSGDVNLLITTAIVESGLDIPRANTIIVNDFLEDKKGNIWIGTLIGGVSIWREGGIIQLGQLG